MDIAHHNVAGDILYRISSAENMEGLLATIDNIGEYYGFDGYCFYHYNAAEQTYFKKDTRPPEFLKLYEEMGGIYVDPVAYLTSTKPQTFHWSQGLTTLELGSEQAEQLGLAREFGIKDGITASVFNRDPYISVISWYSSSYLHVAEVYKTHSHQLDVIAKAVAVKFESFLETLFPPTLTPRERDVLNWVARGKTSNDIGDILAISSSTVDTHLKSTLCKLDALSRSHAVAKAITYRIITL